MTGIMMCAALAFVALSIFYYEYVPTVEEDEFGEKPRYSVVAGLMAINNVYAVHTVDMDELNNNRQSQSQQRKRTRWTRHSISSKKKFGPAAYHANRATIF